MVRDKIIHRITKYSILNDRWNIDRWESTRMLNDKMINLELAAEKGNKNDTILNKK